ncbi:ABC transporter ATP-binding protein/permease [Listeria ilorinensis]|uniref:ABC transporter ATP-binding protein/permease n=1 Tax=Listeria ilorinensis TaxID=2867439 RepID=UPI001EF61AA8|nr:ABC transporter ATP-binding protein/permease [Listeria ilorinensis]
MIDKRLFQLVEKQAIIRIVMTRLLILCLSLATWYLLSSKLAEYISTEKLTHWSYFLLACFSLWLLKSLLIKYTEKLTVSSSANLRLTLRDEVMRKAFRLEKNETEPMRSSTLAQLAVDGIEQLEIYYARFLPQLFYCMLASMLIFAVLVFFAWQPAVALLIAMPLIPLVIMSVMKIAKKILGKYWSQYTDLGARFYESLSGFSVLKAYNKDGAASIKMAEDARAFRKITMRLLSMQLNSITIMDIISYSGAGLGIGLALYSYQDGSLSLTGMLMFILLSAEFFIPMRTLGSLFHVAMNGISACSKLFDYLERPERPFGKAVIAESVGLATITAQQVQFTYHPSAPPVLQQLSLQLTRGRLTAFAGKSGSGKSTFARLLAGKHLPTSGSIDWNGQPLAEISERLLRDKALIVDNHAYLYPQSIRENLLVADETAADEKLWASLKTVGLDELIREMPDNLSTVLLEDGANLSGGERQRLLLARALLKDADFYIFDEITSGVDLESEQAIWEVIQELAQEKIVLFISHRLYNILEADQLVIFENGRIVEQGNPTDLLHSDGYVTQFFAQEQKILKGGAY